MSIRNVFFAGVGGQGLILANQVTARAALAAGLDVKTSDIYGLAMRGGSVYGYLRYGDRVLSSTFAAGQGDLLVAFEPLEALRWAGLMRVGATVVLSPTPILPSAMLLDRAAYPQDIPASLARAELSTRVFDARALALAHGNAKLFNVAMLGAASPSLPEIGLDCFRSAIAATVPSALVVANLAVFEAARDLVGGDAVVECQEQGAR